MQNCSYQLSIRPVEVLVLPIKNWPNWFGTNQGLTTISKHQSISYLLRMTKLKRWRFLTSYILLIMVQGWSCLLWDRTIKSTDTIAALSHTIRVTRLLWITIRSRISTMRCCIMALPSRRMASIFWTHLVSIVLVLFHSFNRFNWIHSVFFF